MVLDMLRAAIVTNAVIFMGVGLYLAFLVSSNLSRPFREIIQVLKGIKRGHLDKKVQVTSNDEIGYTGDVINAMAEGLREREKMRHSLELAREVQQNLLPKSPPISPYMDIAVESIYCDQTGGDYFDFLDLSDDRGNKIGLVVGDVSGHGIPSALLMTTARAFLRLRSNMPGPIDQVVTNVNQQLTQDVENSGQFMTLFYMVIDPKKRSLTWVRAGHDPAMLYDPETDAFKEIVGQGIALGVNASWRYEQNEMPGLNKGQIVILGTDGIWEAQNAAGEMFGKKRIREIIRRNCYETSAEITQAVMNDLSQFQKGAEVSDDVTLLVVKIKEE
jgi:sigma-B regulation protein RsbU (phosphoserine phosphatase)